MFAGFSFQPVGRAYSYMHLARLLVVVLAILSLGLTACTNRPREAAATRIIQPQEAVDPILGIAGSVGTETVAPAAGDGRHTVLALSAGGADGAYGAGVLAGWTASGTRPEFDVVTGVSTGALLAVLAFLGPEYDPLIKKFYTEQSERDVFRRRGAAGLFSDSLLDNEPLKKQIQSVVTPQLLSRIAAEHDKGRRLYIATTNLDAGELTVWDMGKIAKGGRTDPLLHFQKVLRASAAVPGFFQPVYIKPQRGIQLRQAHVDGGVKEPILVSDYMLRSDLPKELYMVVNGSLARLNANQPVEPKLASIAQKSISELIRELTFNTLFKDYLIARSQDAAFYLTSIPDEIPISNGMLEFDQDRMRKLYAAGFEAGKGRPTTWSRKPPQVSGLNEIGEIQD